MSDNRQVRVVDHYGQNNLIGYVKNGILYLPKKKSEHLFRKKNAWCIDVDRFETVSDVQLFIVKEQEEGFNYLTTREAFLNHGEVIEFKGHKKQIALPLEYWEKYPS